MPLVYTKAEIKAYLDSRGLNITDEKMLNTFIRDLKKMIKHEDRQRRRVAMGHEPNDTLLDSTGQSANGVEVEDSETDGRKPVFRQRAEERKKKKKPKSVDNEKHGQIENESYLADVSNQEHDKSHKNESKNVPQSHPKSKPKTISAKGKENRVGGRGKDEVDEGFEHVKPPKATGSKVVMTRKTFNQQGGQPVVEESFVEIGTKDNEQRQKRSKTAPVTTGPRQKNVTQGTAKETTRPKDLTKQNSTESEGPREVTLTGLNLNKTDEMFMILGNLMNEYEDQCTDNQSGRSSKNFRGPSNAVKKDPVALYHYYKGIWDRQKFPGDDRHMKLRWNVRAATVGNFPCIDGRPVQYLRPTTVRNFPCVDSRPAVQYLRC